MKRRFLAMLLSVAMVLTMLPVTAFATDSTPAAQNLTQLTVRAIKATGADGKITLKVTATSDDEDGNPVAVKDFYYRTSTDGSITAPTDGEEIKTSGDANVWTKYDVPFVVTDTVSQIAVIQVATVQEGEGNKLTATGFGSTQAIANELGTLTVTIGTDDDPNAIVVKKGTETSTPSNLKYYTLDTEAALTELNNAKVDWASDTTLTSAESKLGSAISPDPTDPVAITKNESGKYIVVVETGTGSDNSTTVITSLGVTEQVAKFVKPFKLFLGEGESVGTVDQIADVEEADSTYTVTVPVDTEKLTVSGTGVTVTAGEGTTYGENVVTLTATADSHAFTVKTGSGDTEVTYSISVARVKPSLKKSDDTELIAETTRNGNVFTVAEQANSVKTLTLSVPENALKLTLKSASVAYEEKNTTESVNKGLVYLEDGLNTITVTFSDDSTCTIKVTRTAAAPGVALYAGAKAEGTDLLADLEQSPDKTYTVTVPSTTTQVTVGATAGTIASVVYTPTGGTEATATGKTVPVTSAGVNITVKFNDTLATTFTINVSQSAAFVNLTVAEGTGDNAGKVVVTAPTPVPADLRVVVLSKDPAWTETTAASKVTTDIADAIESDVTYTDGAKAIPAAGESDQYVVVYKTDGKFVTHYGVYTVAKVDRELTVKDSSDADAESMITFDPAVHEYAVSVDKSVTGVKIEALPGNTRMSVSSGSTISNGVVQKLAAGGVSTVTVTYMDVTPTASYTIKLVWPMDANSIAPNHQVVTKDVTAVDGAAKVEPEETEVLTAISNTLTANDRDGKDNPVQITATSSPETAEEDLADTTTVTLPASAAELLQDTGIDAKVVTDAGEVTIPSEAIAQTQPGTEDSPAAPVAIAVVVAKKEVATPTEGGIVEAAKFEVTVKKADADGVMEATNITDLQKPITLVFKVLKSVIDEKQIVNPRLAHVKEDGTYEKLTNAEPVLANEVYTFTEKTSHLSEFAVVAEEATTEPEPTGLKITDISVTGAEDFDFVETTKSYDVTALSASKTVSVVITTDTGKYDGITVNGSSYENETEGVKVNLATDGTATIEIKVNDTLKYTINVSKDETPVTEEISIALTDKDGNDIDFGFDPDETTPYTVETDATPVTVTVTGKATVTVGGESATSPVNVVPTETGVKVVVTSTDDPTKTYEITLKKTESTTPVDPTAPKVSIGGKEQTVTFKANENGEMVSEQTLTLESTVDTVTLTVAEGSTIMLDNDIENVTIAATAGTYPVKVETAGEHKITVTDSEGTTYIINLTKEAAAVDENQPSIGDGETGTLEFDKTNEDGSKENTTPITVASTASSYKLNVAAGATVKVNGKDVPVPASGEVTIPLDGSGLFKIEIENKDGTKYIVNVEKQKAPGSLDIAQNGTVNIFAKVEISNIKTGKYYLVKIDVPATVARAASYSYLILDGNGYTSGTATIAPASGSKILVEEYDSMADLASFNSSLKTDSATWTVR